MKSATQRIETVRLCYSRNEPRNLRRNTRCHLRRVRGGKVRDNSVRDALKAFRLAIRAHRRLIKLAPDLYDHARRSFLAAERAEAERNRDEWLSVVREVYGPDAVDRQRSRWPIPEPSPLSSPTQRLLDQELADLEFWLAAAKEALSRAMKLDASSSMDLSMIARLVDTAGTLGRLSAGLETHWLPPEPVANSELTFEEALRKIYGSPEDKSECTDATAVQKGATDWPANYTDPRMPR